MGPVPAPPRSTGAILASAAVVMALIVGVLGVLAVFGIRTYIANAKSAEARSYLSEMSNDAVLAYFREEPLAAGDLPGGSVRRLCPSANAPVPSSTEAIRGRSYQSSTTDWSSDPGFSCLRFEVRQPQYFQYNYTSTTNMFTGRAVGDFNGDGILSTYEIDGEAQNGRVVVAPRIEETNPE